MLFSKNFSDNFPVDTHVLNRDLSNPLLLQVDAAIKPFTAPLPVEA
jgi:hypothetical protein